MSFPRHLKKINRTSFYLPRPKSPADSHDRRDQDSASFDAFHCVKAESYSLYRGPGARNSVGSNAQRHGLMLRTVGMLSPMATPRPQHDVFVLRVDDLAINSDGGYEALLPVLSTTALASSSCIESFPTKSGHAFSRQFL